MSIDAPELAELEQVRGRWRTAVAGVLSKSTRKDPADLGEHPEQLLDSSTYDGFVVRPLYTAFDELPEPPLPGQWPYLRGGDALRDVKSGWKVAEAFPRDLSGATAVGDENSALLAALGEGVSALLLRVGSPGVAPEQLEALLEGVYLSMAPVILDAGADYAAACDAVLALVAEVEPDQRATLSVDLGADPLTAALSGRPAPAIDEVVAVATRVAGDQRRAGDHRRRSRFPQSGRQRDLGAGRRRGGRGGLPPSAHRIRAVDRRGVTADQFPAGRR